MRRLALSSGGALLLALTMLATLAATSLAAEPRWPVSYTHLTLPTKRIV